MDLGSTASFDPLPYWITEEWKNNNLESTLFSDATPIFGRNWASLRQDLANLDIDEFG